MTMTKTWSMAPPVGGDVGVGVGRGVGVAVARGVGVGVGRAVGVGVGEAVGLAVGVAWAETTVTVVMASTLGDAVR